MDPVSVLLPTTIVPDAYRVNLNVDFERYSYSGSVDVDLLVRQECSQISFHALDLEIDYDGVILSDEKLNKYTLSTHTSNPSEETVTLTFSETLTRDSRLNLHLPFTNELRTSMSGFYRSRYVHEGRECWMAVTQFEPVDARRAFPCWDEPSLKATFEISLTIPKSFTVRVSLSLLVLRELTRSAGNFKYAGNTKSRPKRSTIADKNGHVRVFNCVALTFQSFERTPKMSTYLVAFAVGEFDHVEGVTNNGVSMKIYTRPNYAEKCRFALDVGIKSLDFFTSVFNVPYPLPKLDMIAVPDLAASAMENWGLITYHETAIFCDDSTSMRIRQNVASVVAHEEAHQWFGNICTLQWWSELWLNEGFATWAAAYACNAIFPEWDVWTQFCNTYLFGALALDCLQSSHPIQVEIANSRDIDEIFDEISYDKGGSVIRMLVDYVGESRFMQGIHNYLTRYSYSNARTVDLWEQLSQVSNIDVQGLMSTWTTRTGYPLVSVSYENGALHLSQQRFLLTGEDTENTVWNISLAVQTDCSSEVQKFMLTEKSTVVPFQSGFSWLNANADQVGVIRVRYSEDLLRRLFPAVEKQLISAKDRLGLVSNTVALSRAGHAPLTVALELLNCFHEETEFPVWSEICTSLSNIWTIWTTQETAPLLLQFQAQLLSKITERLGWVARENESDSDRQLRPLMLIWSSASFNQSIIERARDLFIEYSNSPDCISKEIRDAVFVIVASNGGENELNTLIQMHDSTEDPDLKLALLRAICHVPKRTEFVLNWSFNSNNIRNKELHVVIRESTARFENRPIVWSYVQKHWDMIVGKLGGLFLLSSVVRSVTSGLMSEEVAQEVNEFFATHKTEGISMTVQQSLEKIRANTAWLQREQAATATWLRAHQQNN